MRSFALGSLLLSSLLGAGPAQAEAPLELRRSPARLNVRASAALDGALIGQIELGVPFTVFARVAGEGCGGDGWGRVEAGGFACLDGAGFALDPPVDLPALIDFNAPSPSEIEAYEETGQYSGRTRSPMLPYIYGKRAGRWGGAVWASEADWLTGAPSIGPAWYFGNMIATSGQTREQAGQLTLQLEGFSTRSRWSASTP